MRCFIVGADDDTDRNLMLAKAAEQLGYQALSVLSVGKLQVDPRFIDATRPLVLVTDEHAVGDAVQLARDEQGRAFVVCVGDTIAPDLYKQLVRTRSGDWVKWQTCVPELRDLVAALKSAELRQPTAKVLSFAASKGGVGNTTLALETAIHLATRRKRGSPRVAILDLNLQGGTLADALDVEPRFDIAEIDGRPERLDEQLIDVFTSRHSSGLDVFASPARPTAMDDLDPQIVFAFIDSLSTRYEAILLDLPQHRLPWTDNLLQGADAIVVAGGSHVPALRRLTAKLAHLEALGIPESRLAAVVNHCSVDLLGRFSHRAEIERALAGHRTFFVRRDCDAVGSASNIGGSLMELMPNSRVCRDIKRLAEWVGAVTDGRAGPGPEPALRPESAL